MLRWILYHTKYDVSYKSTLRSAQNGDLQRQKWTWLYCSFPGLESLAKLSMRARFAAAIFGYLGSLYISWSSVIVADLWWEGKPGFLICIFYLMEISLPPLVSSSTGMWVIFLLQNSSKMFGHLATAEGHAMLYWDKVYLTWHMNPKPLRIVGGMFYLIILSWAAGWNVCGIGQKIEWGLSYLSIGPPWRRQAPV